MKHEIQGGGVGAPARKRIGAATQEAARGVDSLPGAGDWLPGVPVILTHRARSLILPVRARTAAQLHQWLRLVLDVDVPLVSRCAGSDAPFEYLCHAFFEPGMRRERAGVIRGEAVRQSSGREDLARPDELAVAHGEDARRGSCGAQAGRLCHQTGGPSHQPATATPSGDCVVWAPRGGGKTFYAAVATLLDMLFKPGIEVKILAGSMEQAQRMHAHLRALLARPALRGLVQGRITDRRATLTNGSTVQVLAQSHASVRGARPQKIRCDEVELFDPEVWEAAQLVTRGRRCGPVMVRGAVEALSTHHVSGGLMERLIAQSARGAAGAHDGAERTAPGAIPGAVPGVRRLFRWSVVDVLERCPIERPCEGCGLREECDGLARQGRGHVLIDDALMQKARVGRATWEAEMLCSRPHTDGAVFGEFDERAHVSEFEVVAGGAAKWVAGMDFGYRNPAAIVWGFVDETGVLRIVDERIAREATVERHARAIVESRWPRPAWIGVDPAGRARSEQTGESAVAVLRRQGLTVKWRASNVEFGIGLIRARLAPASGSARLFIHARCTGLIGALRRYRYGDGGRGGPVKDGNDHAVDALRYLVLNLDAGWQSGMSRYV